MRKTNKLSGELDYGELQNAEIVVTKAVQKLMSSQELDEYKVWE